jgi:acetyl-CoA acyltransferase
MAAAVIAEALRRAPGVEPSEVEDVILGCAMPEAEQGLNVARIASLRAGVPVSASAVTVNRFCSSGLQAIAYAGERIMCGFANVVVAGGTESMSMVPMGGNKVSPNPALVDNYPDVYLSTGLVAENHARENSLSREEQDAFALRSQRRWAAAAEGGRFDDELVALNGVERDEHPRPETTAEKLGALQPVFREGGTVTAGNASGINDGAAALVIASEEKARELGADSLGAFVGSAVAGVDPRVMGIGPIPAVRKLLERTGVGVDQLDLVELNEAFASQSLVVIRELGLDEDKVNVNGGAIALGHPLGMSGARLVVSLLHELRRRGGTYGLATLCVGVGQGQAALFERTAS